MNARTIEIEHVKDGEYLFDCDRCCEMADTILELTEALADAIRRPMGVIPKSAEPFIFDSDMEAAEERRRRI